MGKGSFIIYDTDIGSLSYLTDAQAGKIFKAIADYRHKGVKPDLGKNPAVNILYNQIIEHITINEEKYKFTCEKRSETMKKRWNDKKSSIVDYSAQQSTIVEGSLLGDNDNVNDIVNVNDNDNVNDIVAFGVNRENKRKNYYNKNQKFPPEGEPSYDLDAFTKKAIGLKYQKKETQC